MLNKKQFYFCMLIMALSNSSAHAADNVLYCVESRAAGLNSNDGYSRAVLFTEKRFTIQVDRNNLSIKVKFDDNLRNYSCRNFGSFMTCEKDAYMFNFNPTNGRFILSWGHGDLMGNDGDSLRISKGSCGRF